MSSPQPTTMAERLAQDPRRRVWDRPADGIRQAAADFYGQVRGDARLTAQAKRTAIAARYVQAKRQLDTMNTASPTAKAAELANAKRAAFGIDDLLAGASPAERAAIAASFRDAQQRASQLTTPTETQRALDQATQSGDDLMVRAVGNHAIAAGHMTVADDYLTANPARAEAVRQVERLGRIPNFADLTEFVCPVPDEVRGMTYAELEEAARTQGVAT